MRLVRGAVGVAAAAAVLAAPAVARAPGLPSEGVFVPGESLGGVALGMTKADVTAAWGERHGVCRGCARQTWYFNTKPFEPQGAGVELRHGRVTRVFTLWRPHGWKADSGLVLGARSDAFVAAYPDYHAAACRGYTAFLPGGGSKRVGVFYVYRGRLWAFGLMPRTANPCL